MVIAGKLSEEFSLLKRKIKNKKNINKFLTEEKRNIQKKFNVKIEYLELRNEKNLLLSNKSSQSKIFVSYYFKNIRFIDNF